MARRLNVMLDDDAAALLVQLAGGERKQGAFLSTLIRATAASTTGAPAEGDEAPAVPDDPTEPIRMDAYQVATQLNVLTNRLMEIAEQPTRAVWTRIDG
jgi:hypothetical protein